MINFSGGQPSSNTRQFDPRHLFYEVSMVRYTPIFFFFFFSGILGRDVGMAASRAVSKSPNEFHMEYYPAAHSYAHIVGKY